MLKGKIGRRVHRKTEKNKVTTLNMVLDLFVLVFICSFMAMGIFYFAFSSIGVNGTLVMTGFFSAICGMYLVLMYKDAIRE